MNRVRLAFFYCFGFISIGCILSQLIPLLNKDFSTFTKSLILGIGALTSFFMSILIGKISDSIKKIKPSIYINMILYLIVIVFIFISHSKILKGISFIFVIAISRILMSTIETFVLTLKKETFMKYHCMGAIGLMIGSLFSSFLNTSQTILLCMGSGILCILIGLPIKEIKKENKKIQLKDMIHLLKNHRYLRILLLFFFLMMMGFADQYVVVEKMQSLGASSTLISIKYAIQAFMEIPLYLMIHHLLKRFDNHSILVVCILMSAIKLGLYAMATSSMFIIFTSLLQIVTHPMFVILSKKMIEDCTSVELMSSSQVIGFAFYFSISGFIASILSEWLNTQFSYNITLYVFAMFSIFSFIIWCFIKKYDKVKVVVTNEDIFN